jgi:hypothetical protein
MLSYPSDQNRKIRIESWLPTGDANPVDPTLERMETAQNLFKWDRLILFRMKNERMIVTIRAAEITGREEEDRTDLPSPIDKGGL